MTVQGETNREDKAVEPVSLMCQPTTIRTFGIESLAPWRLISVPVCAVPLPWLSERCHSEVRLMRRCDDDTYEFAIEDSYVVNFEWLLYDYHPELPQLAEEKVYGVREAREKARARWLLQVETVTYSQQPLEIKEAYWGLNHSLGLKKQLERRLLIRDISESSTVVQLELARNLLFLFLNMEANHSSEECQLYIGSDQDGLLESLQSGLQAGMQPHALPNRTERDEAQVTSIFRKLLELSGFGTDRLRHDLDNDYTASENSDFCASVFGMPRTSTFGEFDTETMSTILSRAKVFKGVEISAEYLQRRTVMMKSFLRIGLAEEHRNLPPTLLENLSIGQLDAFNAYLAYSYERIPGFQVQGSEIALLLTYGHQLPDTDHEVLVTWTKSEQGRRSYELLTANYGNAHSVGQLALATAALVSYRRLCPDYLDQHPVSWSSLGDLDSLLQGEEIGNSGRIAELVMHALIRNLHPKKDHLEHLVIFLVTVLNQACPPLHWLEGLMDQNLRLRISGQSHAGAMGRMEAVISRLKNIPCSRDLVLRSRQ